MGAEPREEYPRTYSDVVASRPGSPARKSGDSVVMPIGRGNTRADRVANESVQGNEDTTFIIKKLVNKPVSASESSSEAENRNEWTTVQRRRRARSAEPTPTRKVREVPKYRVPKPAELEKEFSKVVREAEKSLTPAEHETIA